ARQVADPDLLLRVVLRHLAVVDEVDRALVQLVELEPAHRPVRHLEVQRLRRLVVGDGLALDEGAVLELDVVVVEGEGRRAEREDRGERKERALQVVHGAHFFPPIFSVPHTQFGLSGLFCPFMHSGCGQPSKSPSGVPQMHLGTAADDVAWCSSLFDDLQAPSASTAPSRRMTAYFMARSLPSRSGLSNL